MSDTEQFDFYRNKLIGLTEIAEQYAKELEQDEDFKTYVEKTRAEIFYSLSILRNNVFPIALFAKMQSGKSTTTAAMADGREITPCAKGGGGMRTSTVSVTIYNDDTVKEISKDGVRTTPVEINLYSDQELVECIIESAGGNLPSNNPNFYDLNTPEDRESLKSAVELEIEFYKRDIKSYPTSKLATLREAILILAFYGCDAHQKLCAGEFSTIAGIQVFLKAEKWEQKWEKLAEDGFDETVKKFTAEEILHVFINSIIVPVKSEFMAKTGTAVTDAPGTMANLRDTMRAIRAASESAVIVFVLNGDREFTEGERNQLRTLRESGMADKVVFVLNFKRPPEEIQENGLEDSICSVLKQEGFTAPHHKNFLYYNAYLAKLAFQGEMIASGNLDELSMKRILEDANAGKKKIKYDSPNEAWEKLTRKALQTIDCDDLADKVDAEALTPSSEILQEIRAVSRWDTMILSLRAHILNNRAAGVLLDLGTRPVIRTLESIEKILKQREDATEKFRADIEAQYSAAKKIFETFSAEAATVLGENFHDGIDEALVQNYYDSVVLGSVEVAADEAAPLIFQSTGILANAKDLGKKVTTKIANGFISVFNAGAKVLGSEKKITKIEHVDIQARCNNILNNSYRENVIINSAAWSENLEQSRTYRDNVLTTVLNVQKKLQQIWNNLKLGDNVLLQNITPVPDHLTGTIKKDIRLNKNLIKNLDTTMEAKFTALSNIKYIFFTTATYLALSLTVCTIPIIGPILGVIAATIATMNFLFETEEERQQRILELAKKISFDLNGELSQNRYSIKASIIKGAPPKNPGMSIYREFYVDLFNATIEQKKIELKEKYERALAELKLTEEERERIRRKARKWRTTRITPLRENVATAEQEIAEIWRGN